MSTNARIRDVMTSDGLKAMKSRPCERLCRKCDLWKHYSRFRSFKRKDRPAGEVDQLHQIGFSPICRDCEQIAINEKKNADRPFAILWNRTGRWARKLGIPREFLWINMNWRALLPELRAMMSEEGLCLSCGHDFTNERDIHLEHREPPRHPQDWARHHARNIGIYCHSCNTTKGEKPYSEWLDEQEGARLSNEIHNEQEAPQQHELSLV